MKIAPIPFIALLLLAAQCHACDIVPIQSVDPTQIFSESFLDSKYAGVYLGVVEEVIPEGQEEISRIRITEYFKGLKALPEARARESIGAGACGVKRAVGDEVMVVIYVGAYDSPRAYSVKHNDPFVLKLREAKREAEEKSYRALTDFTFQMFGSLLSMYTASIEVCAKEFPEHAKRNEETIQGTRSKNLDLFLHVESRQGFLDSVQAERTALLKSPPAELAEFCTKGSELMADFPSLAAQSSKLLRLMSEKAASQRK